MPILKIDGSTASPARDTVYETMEKSVGSAIAVIQTQSGGIARSLAEAQHVMFASRGFSFVEEEQARDRVYKPGQRRVVYDYVAEGTIDEYIGEILKSKEAMHHAVRNADRESDRLRWAPAATPTESTGMKADAEAALIAASAQSDARRKEMGLGSMYFDRQGQPIGLYDWVRLFEDPKYKRIALTQLPDGRVVSTVWGLRPRLLHAGNLRVHVLRGARDR